MRSALLIFVAITAAFAADNGTVPIDKWRVKAGDDIRWAQPDLDDSAWQTSAWPKRYNTSQQFFAGVRWYRATVSIPSSLAGQPLAIGIGPLDEVYDVYVNGTLVGTFGNWKPVPVGSFQRFISFPIPEAALHRPTAVVAIRRWTGASRTNFAVLVGAFRGTAPPEIGPRELERVVQEFRAESRINNFIANLIAALGDLGAGFISLALYLSSRRRHRSNLWLGVALVTGSTASLIGWTVPFSSLALRTPIAGTLVTSTFLTAGLWSLFLASICPLLRKPLRVTAGLQMGIAIMLGISYSTQLPFPYIFLQLITWLGLAASIATVAVLLADRQGAYSRLLAGVLFLGPAAEFWFTQIANWTHVVDDLRYIHVAGLLIDPRNVARLLFAVTALCVLYIRHRNEQEGQAEELTAARLVQESLLLGRGFESQGYTVESAYLPASEVGGDFYQKLVYDDGSLMLLVGDVSGKGLHAAMLVSHICGALSNERSREPGVVLSNLNGALTGRVSGGFVTCCCARFDPDGQVTVANAGHLSPYVGGRELMMEAGLPLGVATGIEYTETRLRLEADDAFVLVSDGVVEAANSRTELFGFDRLRDIGGKSAAAIAETARIWGQNDDITVVAVRRIV